MMQPSYQELVGKVMSNLTFGLTDGTFTWGRYAVFLILGAFLWIAIPRYVTALKHGPQAANRATAIAGVALLLCLTPLTAVIGAGIWLWTIIMALRVQREA
ncbi:hypothetical protein [Burkholderia cenocepacia]|uniref:hypothetical protein n=1 Tax=Burkholderia cenocepacia TaxID=95486 RepID=UPI002232543F|nr:hypothetical protein [Burkholderia cenocepacia]MCW3632536.1 hypothetical protein [Burkholderia cenocepacia]MCW5181766.1 hypothetical protein [Burkholderia cenocepacia]